MLMIKNLLVIQLVLVLLLVGCGPAANDLADTPTIVEETPTEIPIVTPSETPEEVIEPTLEPTEPVVVPTTNGSVLGCVEPSEHDPLPVVAYEDYPAAIMEFLNQGASPEELAVELILRELGPTEQPVRSEDLTADGYRDVIVSIYNLQIHPQGAMMVYSCQNGEYVLSYISLAQQAEHAPEALLIQDLNNDDVLDLVFTVVSCGAHTCFDEVQILSWVDGAFSERVEGSTAELPNPSAQLTDYDRDAIYSLEVVGTAIASVGAGPQRDNTMIWEYAPTDGMWKFSSETLAASPFRIHLIHDADDAMLRGEYQIAALLYAQVVEDENLLDWLDPAEEEQDLGAYSYFKRVVAAGFLAQIQEGADLLDEMTEEYGDTPQEDYLEMAQAFWQEFTTSGVAENGCEAAHQYAVLNQAAVLNPLSSITYGYANRDYGPTDICP
jgi:hypothetical protein